MKRGALQAWTLSIWLFGLIVLQAIVLIAGSHYKVDAFILKAKDVAFFERSKATQDEAQMRQAKMVLEMLSQNGIKHRTRPEFLASLRVQLPHGPSGIPDEWVIFLVDGAAENRMAGLQKTFLQIYLPWLAVMIAGLFGDTTRRAVDVFKARASIICSVVLQVLFVLFVLSNLFFGDLAAMREEIGLVATLLTALVGTLVQFVFPAAPEVKAPAVTPEKPMK